MPPINKKGQPLLFSSKKIEELKKNHEFQRRRSEFFKTKSEKDKEEAEKLLKELTKRQFPLIKSEALLDRLTTIALFDLKKIKQRAYLDEALGDRVFFIYIPALKFLCNVLYDRPDERKRMTDIIDKKGVDAILFKEIDERLKEFLRQELGGLAATVDPYEASPDNLAICISKMLVKYATRPEVDEQLYNYIKHENTNTKAELLKKDKTIKTIVDIFDKKITPKNIVDEINVKKDALITRVGAVDPLSVKMIKEISKEINPKTQLPIQAEAAKMLSDMFSFEAGEFDIRKMLEHINAQEQCKQAIGVPDEHMLRGTCYICGQQYRGKEHDLTIECEHILCVLIAIEYYTLIQHTTLTDDQKDISRLLYLYSNACCNRKKSNLVYILQQGGDTLGISKNAILLTLGKILHDVRETVVDGIKCQTMWRPEFRSTLTQNLLQLGGGTSEKEITGGAIREENNGQVIIDQIKQQEPGNIQANIDRWVNERTVEINRKVFPMVKFANKILNQI